VPVGKLIALLAEEGDDLSNIEIPTEVDVAPSVPSTPSASQSELAQPPSPPHSAPKGSTGHIHPGGPIFPSVLRLLNEIHVTDFKKIKGTGVRGMVTKGDILAYLGKASTPTGTFKHVSTKVTDLAGPTAPATPKEVKVQSANSVSRRL
jgi:pyruvate/2-oxoglutarate dehydrogenase complex dihydrolipoamide acyltransferase (E2) component